MKLQTKTTLAKLLGGATSVPMTTAWYLTDIAEAKGKQELFTKQSPQRLKALREHAIIESALASNRIEGVEIDPHRIKAVFAKNAPLRDRNEEEVRGYSEALRLIHESSQRLDVSEDTILRLHRTTRGEIWDAGKYKAKDVDIIENYPDGRSRVRFKCVTAKKTPAAMAALCAQWSEAMSGAEVHPLVSLGAFALDFLCIHPFRDGNGRVSRLLMLLQCYHLGIEVGRYVSLESLIEQNKERYYETLEQSSVGWHEGTNDPWPFVSYCLFIIKSAYREFEERVGQVAAPRGAKTELVQAAIDRTTSEFTLAAIERSCPGVSRDMIRRVLRDMQQAGRVECIGRGPGAKWRKSVLPLKEGKKRGNKKRR